MNNSRTSFSFIFIIHIQTSNFRNTARNSINKQFGRNHQRVRWPGEDKTVEASSKSEQPQNQRPPLQCWGCGEAHYYRDCPQRNKTEAVNNLQEASTVGDVARSIPRINAALEDRQAYFQPTMIELEGNLLSKTVSVLVDPGASLSYISPKLVEVCKLPSQKFKKTWLV